MISSAPQSQVRILEPFNTADDDDDDKGMYNDIGVRDKGFTKDDLQDMRRMGKRQEMIRNFRPLSALSFTVLIQATWEFLLIANTQGLVNGGLAGLWWSYVLTFLGFGIVMLSLAEMASMAPTTGGQYHWVSEFAPPKFQKPFSYITGWIAVLSWQSGTASGSFLTGTLIQALITINNPNYVPENWHGTLLDISMVFLLFVSNVWGAHILPLLQNLLLVLHVFGLFAIVIVLWVMSPRNPPEEVFMHFRNSGGWSNIGLSLMVGQMSAILSCICSDSTVHISEETEHANHTIPWAMFWAYIINGVLGLMLLTTYLFCVTDIEAALEDPTDYPFIWVFRQAVSTQGVNIMTIIVLLLILASGMAFNASAARQTFAFARDKGLPFHALISKIHPTHHIPYNATVLTCSISALLALINIFSTTAFNAMVSLQISALMFTYACAVGSVLYQRLCHPHRVPTARWSLGRWGVPVNVFGVVYSTYAFFWSFWPSTPIDDLENLNYAPVLFIAVSLLAVIMYLVQGRRIYSGPVVQVDVRI